MEKSVLFFTVGGNVQPLWKTLWRYLKKLNLELPYDPAIPNLTYKSFIGKDTCTPMFDGALFTIAKTWKQPKCPLTGVNGLIRCGIYSQWNTTQPQKRTR